MLDLNNLEVNIPSTEFGTYTTVLSAPPKFGKTGFCTQYPKPLILDFEEGSAGKVVYRVPCAKWTDVKKYCKQLTANPDLKNKFQTICIDTVNYALEACKQYIIDQYQAQHPDKIIDTFNKIPYGGGHELLSKEFKGAINSLKRAGYGVVLVSHIKDKIFDKESESEHTKTVPDLSDRERNMVSATADFLLLGDFELEVLEPAIKDNTGKVLKEAVVKNNRILYLRTSESAEAGFRWENVPEKIPFDYDIFKEIFDEAVMEEIEKGKVKYNLSEAKATEIRKDLDSQKKKNEQELFEETKIELTVDQLVEEIVLQSKEKVAKEPSNGVKINKILGNKHPATFITDIEQANKILEAIKSL